MMYTKKKSNIKRIKAWAVLRNNGTIAQFPQIPYFTKPNPKSDPLSLYKRPWKMTRPDIRFVRVTITYSISATKERPNK